MFVLTCEVSEKLMAQMKSSRSRPRVNGQYLGDKFKLDTGGYNFDHLFPVLEDIQSILLRNSYSET